MKSLNFQALAGISKKQRYNFTITPEVKSAAASLACQRNTTLSALIESLLAREVSAAAEAPAAADEVGAHAKAPSR